MAFTEFYCRAADGSNLNAGSQNAAAAAFTYASGSWVASTGVFTVASGNTSSDGVAVGDFASVYADGATVGVFVGRVTARDATTITVSLTAKSGTAPTDGTNTRTLKVGGAFKGPNAAEVFPFSFAQSTMTDSGGNPPRINFTGTFNVSAGITHANNGVIAWEGYTTSPGDDGKATIDGGVAGAGYTILTISGTGNLFKNFIIQNNGASGAAHGLAVSGAGTVVIGCVAHDLRQHGFNISSAACLVKCEAYNCNQSNTANSGGFAFPAGANALVSRCISHDNSGTQTVGFYSDAGVVLEHCIADSNGGRGFYFNTNGIVRLLNCDSYNNIGSGVEIFGATKLFLQNCNFVKNGAWGILATSASSLIVSNYSRFGAGTQANTSGEVSSYVGIVQFTTASYSADVTPWADPANGDFRINLSAAKGAGDGAFTQTAASYSGTTAYPDIGAAQHQETASSSGGTFPFFRHRYRAR